MDYCKNCKSKLEYRNKSELLTATDYQIPIFYCPVCKRDVKQAEVLRFEDMIMERLIKLEEDLYGN